MTRGSLGGPLGSSEGLWFLGGILWAVVKAMGSCVFFFFLQADRRLSTVSVFLIQSILYYFSLPGEEKCLDTHPLCSGAFLQYARLIIHGLVSPYNNPVG